MTCLLVMLGIGLGLYGVGCLGDSVIGRTRRARVLSGIVGAAIVVPLLVALVAVSVAWLIPVVMVVSAVTVKVARTRVVDHRAAGTDPSRPWRVMITTCAISPFVVAALAAASPLDRGVGLFFFFVTFWGLALIALGYQPPPSTAAERRASRNTWGEASLWFLR